MTIEIARLVRVSVSDAEVRRSVSAVIRTSYQPPPPLAPPPEGKGGNEKIISPPHVGRGSERGRGISVAFVGPSEMRRLNRTYHGEDRVTDVLSFGSSAAAQQRSSARRMKRSPAALLPVDPVAVPDLGELVVCPSHVRANAKRAGEPFRRELARVLVHGTLHLLGHDHARPREAERMFALQESIVRRATRS